MTSGKKSKPARQAQAAMVTGRSRPWGNILGALVVVLLTGGVFGYTFLADLRGQDPEAGLAAFTPSASNQDPSTQIPGVTVQTYQGGSHVGPTERVAYTLSPPTGGTHDQYWAACSGAVYDQPVRSENLVHSMEHGAVWIAYNPDQISGEALQRLADRVENQPYSALSPYPGLDQPIALQSWGHQLKLSDAADPRIDQFLTALRRNQYTHPEVGASCQALGPGQFDQNAPPPYQPAPPVSAVGQPGTRAEAEAAAVPAQPDSGPPTGGGS